MTIIDQPKLAGRLVAAMEKEGDSFRLPSLAEGLGPLGERVPPEKAAELAGRLLCPYRFVGCLEA